MARRPQPPAPYVDEDDDYSAEDFRQAWEEHEKTRELTGDERERLREILKRYEHRAWLWSLIAVWAKWVGSIGGAAVAIKLLWAELRGLL